MFQTIRQRFAFTLLAFVSITILSILLLYYYIQRKERSFSRFKYTIETTNTLILKDVTVLRDFFENETINPAFFHTKKSKLLATHNNLNHQIQKSIQAVDSLQNLKEFELGVELDELKTNFKKYNDLIDEIVKAILNRGFKDDGLEGDMRNFAHQLENYQSELGLVNILQLRRHEKDFIIRQEDDYVQKHGLLIARLMKSLEGKAGLNPKLKNEMSVLLSNYQNRFKSLVDFDKKIGIKNSIGLKAAIDNQVNLMEGNLQGIISKARLLEEQTQATLRIIFFSFLGMFVVISLIATAFISKKFTHAITDLKVKISEFVAGDFSKRNILPVKNAKYEIDSLANNFSLMEQHILNQMNALRSTNAELAVLIGRASKDIKKPLMEIKGGYEDLNKGYSSQRAQQIERSWNKILTIVEELSKVKDIKTEEIFIEKINLVQLIKSVYQEHKNLPQFDQVVFSLTFALKQEFYSSKELISHIFYHLFENSIKYSKVRKGFSFLNVKVESQDKYMIKVVVADNGIGIKKEDQDRIFEVFYRTANKLEGNGLGLYIVQNSLKKINGTILLESDENTGTVFTLLIPNKVDSASTPGPTDKKEQHELSSTEAEMPSVQA